MTGLTTGTAYYYEVRARGGGLLSDFSNVALAMTAPYLQATASASDEVDLEWSNPIQNADSFQIERSDDGEQTFNTLDSVDSSTNTYVDWSAQSNGTYVYQVLAVVNGGTNVNSNAVAAVTPAESISDLATSYATADEIDISFTVNDPNATAIEIDRGTDGQPFGTLTTTLPLGTTEYQDGGLARGTQYWYRICAVDPSGPMAFSTLTAWTLTDQLYTGATATDTAGQSFSGTVADFPSALPDSNLADYHALIQWGDGESSNGIVAPDGNGGFVVTGTHDYSAPGVETTDIIVDDGQGDTTEAFGSMTVSDSGPTVATAATATLSGDGVTAELSALGSDDAGEDDLTYTWAVLGTPPQPVTFDDNGDNSSKDAIATFTAVGTYDFEVTIANSAGLSTTSAVSVTVDQVDSDITVTPDAPTIAAEQVQQFAATATDQFGNPMSTQPSFWWDVADPVGSIDQTGLFTTGNNDHGEVTIDVSASDGQTGGTTAQVTPTITLTAAPVPDDNFPQVLSFDMQLDFSVPADATDYFIERQAPGENFEAITPGSRYVGNTEYQDIGLALDTTYNYRICAEIDQQLVYSATVSATTYGGSSAAPAPQDVSVQGLGDSDAGNEVVFTLGTYDPALYTPAGTIVQLSSLGTPGSWDTMGMYPPGSPLVHILPAARSNAFASEQVRLIEVYNGGTVYSAPSTPATLLSIPAVNAPTDLSVAPLGGGQYAAQWTDDQDGTVVGVGDTAHGFQMLGSFSAGTNHFLFSQASKITFSVFAESHDGYLSPALSVSAVTVQPPAAPAGEAISLCTVDDDEGSELGIKIDWRDAATNETGYIVLRSTTGTVGNFQQIATLPADSQSYTDVDPPPTNNLCVYEVEATNSAGPSTPTMLATGSPFPPAPTGLTAVRDEEDGSADLAWNPTTSQDGFEIQWSTDGQNFTTIDTVPVNQYSYVDADPEQNAQNYYQIVAFNNIDDATAESNPSNLASADPVSSPVAVDLANGGTFGPTPFTTSSGHALSVSAADGVLQHDFDLQNLPLTVTAFTQPLVGSVTVNPDGSFTYTPTAKFVGEDEFTYTVSNGIAQSQATVAVTVVDPPPTAGNASYSVSKENSVSVPATGNGSLSAQGQNPSGGTLTYRLAGPTTKYGALTFNSDGSFRYVPGSSYKGWDTFSYIVNDGVNDSQPATVTFTIPGTHYDPNRKLPPPPLVVRTAQGLLAGYDEAQRLLGVVMADYAVLGQATKAIATATPANQVTLTNFAMSCAESVQAAYDKYVDQVNVTQEMCGYYMKDAGIFTNQDVVKKIFTLKILLVGLSPDRNQIKAMAVAAQAMSDGATVVLDQATFAVNTIQAAHDTCETILAVGGVTAIIEAGVEVATEQGCAALAEYAAKQLLYLEVGAVVNAAMGYAVQWAVDHGLNPEYVQIGADALQLMFLLVALKAERAKVGANCFAGDTPVVTSNHGDQAIDDIHLGERVDTTVNDGSDPGAPPPPIGDPNATAVDPATWREVDLTMSDPTTPGDSYQMQLLEPASWISDNDASVGGWVNLDLPELQISGLAQVQSISACPAIEGGAGRVVLGTFEHVSNDVVDVNLVGESQPLQVTAGHKLWSLDRHGWVTAGELHSGERLAGENGPVIVESVTADGIPGTVYNLDVEADHRYLVTDGGVVAHNATPCPKPGELQNVDEYMSDTAAKYQLQVTGTPKGQAYVVDGVKFDGYENGVLLEAKGPGYDGLTKSLSETRLKELAARQFAQAQRQLLAAKGVPIEWRVADQGFADQLATFFKNRRLPIKVTCVPMQF